MNIRFGMVLGLSLAATAVAAQSVVLKTVDGFATFEGELLSFDGTLLTVETSVGVVSIPAEEVICEGSGCPAEKVAGLSVTEPVSVAVTPEPEPAGIGTPNELGSAAPVEGFSILVETPTLTDALTALARDFSAAAGASGSRVASLDPSRSVPGNVQVFGKDRAPADIAPALVVRSVAPGPESDAQGTIGYDGLAVIVSPRVGIRSISLTELARIYAGEITNWRELGGPDAKIVPLVREIGSPERAEVEQLILDPLGLELSRSVIGVDNHRGIEDGMQMFGAAIGILPLSSLRSTAPVQLRGTCGLAAAPDRFAFASGAYPLAKAVTATPPANASEPGAEEFLSWLESADGQAAIDAQTLVGTGIVRGRGAQRARRLANALSLAERSDVDTDTLEAMRTMVTDLVVAEQLSTVFHSDAAKALTDRRVGEAIARLARHLERPEFDGATVLFAGFDGGSDARATTQIDRSDIRARGLLAVFLSSAPSLANRITFEARGFGPAAPLVCDDNGRAADINSRVEIWVTLQPT